MPKAILFDADGVVLKKLDEYFSVRFAREHGAPLEEVTEFFKTTYRECQLGKADLKEELDKVLPSWGWTKSTDEFLEYWLVPEMVVDKEVMKKVAEYRSKGIKCYLATDQEKYRADYIRRRLDLSNQFDDLFFSYELDASKDESKFFEHIIDRLDLPAAEIAYRDDDKKNVKVAKELGIEAKFYERISDLDIVNKESQIPKIQNI
jgi:putative hydrolase of the HAD superfamily